jgi:ribulose 1,5-bisphosphate carboxylase large subunit-like protein
MTKQIEAIMALADEWADQCGGCDSSHLAENSPYRKALRQALEAVMKECHNVTLDLAKEVCRQVVRDTNSTLTWEGCNEIQEALEKEKT